MITSLSRIYNSSSNLGTLTTSKTITSTVASSTIFTDEVTVDVIITTTFYYYWSSGNWYFPKATIKARLKSRTCSSGKLVTEYESGFLMKDLSSSSISYSGFTSAPGWSRVTYGSGEGTSTEGYSWNKYYKNMTTSYIDVATIYFSGSYITPAINTGSTSTTRNIALVSNFYWAPRFGDKTLVGSNTAKSEFTTTAIKFSITTDPSASNSDYTISGGSLTCDYNKNFTLPSLKHTADTDGNRIYYTLYWNSRGGSDVDDTTSNPKETKIEYYDEYWQSTNNDVKFNPKGTPSYTYGGDKFKAHTWYRTITTKEATVGTIPGKPTLRGYTCRGWYTSSSGTSQVTKDTIVTGNTTFYAQWDARAYDVDYKLAGDGAYWVNNEKPTKISNKYFGSAAIITSIKPKRKGYKFVGWHTDPAKDPTSSRIILTTDSSSTVGSKLDYLWNESNITLVPIWTPINHTVTYHYYLIDGGSEITESETFNIETTSYSYFDPKQSRGGDWVLFGWTKVRPYYWGDPSQILEQDNKVWAYGTFKNPDDAPANVKPFEITDISSMTEEQWEDTTPINVYGFWTITGKYIKITNTGDDSIDWKKISVAYYKAEDEKWHVINNIGYKDSKGQWHPEIGREFK